MPLVFKETNGKKGDFLFLRKSEVLMIMLLWVGRLEQDSIGI